MPLASLAALQWYGPACAALKSQDAQGSLLEATPHQRLRPAITVIGTGTAQTLRPYRGYAAALQVAGDSFLVAAPKKKLRFGLIVDVGAVPSAFDIAQAIWNAPKVSYNAPGTMGNAVNSAGTAGDPTEAIMTDPRMLTVPKFLGLK